jgi:hypothetical protein
MASTHEPQYPLIDLVLQAVTEAMAAGTIAIRNFPATQPVSGTFWPTTQPVSGNVSIANFPALQSCNVVNFPAIQTIGGSVAVNNFPATQAVSGAVQIAANTATAVATRLPGYTPSSSPGTIPLTSTPTLVNSVFIRGVKNTGANNSAIVFLGTSGAAVNQSIPIEPGAGILETAPAGKKLDLSQIYIRVLTAGDAVSWIASN